MNKKPTILAVGVLGSLALIGTGFAGWVITATATEEANGSITAYTVADNRVFIDEAVYWDDVQVTNENNLKGQIVFGKPSTYAETTDGSGNTVQWLTATSDMGVEHLSAVYKFSGKFTNANLNITATYNITGDAANLAAYSDALGNTKKLIEGPAIPGEQVSNVIGTTSTAAGVYYTVRKSTDSTTDDYEDIGDANKGTLRHLFEIEVHWNFKWGQRFGGENPFDHYNELLPNSEHTSGITNADDASAALADLAKANGVNFSFNFELTSSAPTASN